MDIINLSQWTEKDRETVLNGQINTTLIADRTTLNFENIEKDLPGKDLSEPFEAPPAGTDQQLKDLLLIAASDDPKSRWIRTMARVYLAGGKIIYRKVGDEFEVRIIFG